jgi:hypothetical protein
VVDGAQTRIQQLLTELEGGSRAALDELLPHVYHELSELAHRARARWQGNDTLTRFGTVLPNDRVPFTSSWPLL